VPWSRKPLAPAASAAYTYSSRSKVVSMRIHRAVRAGEPAGRLDVVQSRHPDVHQDHVRLVLGAQLDDGQPVRGQPTSLSGVRRERAPAA
jgi:hypothetical protein